MARDALTQSEIDSLIKAINIGAVEGKEPEREEKHRSYDFRKPTKFSKEQLKTLHVIHDNYSRITGSFLSAFLRTAVKLETVSVTQVTYEEFMLSLPVPTLMTVFKLSPDLGVGMLETNPSFTFMMIDLLFGGKGKTSTKARELTEIEISVMRQINEKLLDNLKYAWKGIAQFAPQIENMDINPQFNQVIASSETVALVALSVQLQSMQSFINLCFPYIALDRVLSSLTAQHWFNQFQQVTEKPVASKAGRSLNAAEVEVKVILGRSEITMEELLQLQEGDVLQVKRRSGEPLDLLIENHPVFKGQPGLKGKHLAVKITGLSPGKESLYA